MQESQTRRKKYAQIDKSLGKEGDVERQQKEESVNPKFCYHPLIYIYTFIRR